MTTKIEGASRPRASLWGHRFLVWNFARRDLKSRFKGTVVGWTWSLILPLATVVIYTIVFSVFIRIEPPAMGDGDSGNYGVWLLVGLVAWTFMLNTITMSMPTVLSNGALLQKVYFPSYVPSVGALIAIGIQSLIELAIVLGLLAALGNVSWTWLVLPVWLALMAVFTGAVAYVLAILNVFYRDVAQLVAVTMQLLFFLSAIIYPMSLVPEQWRGIPVRAVLEISPVYQFIDVVRQLTYNLTVPSPQMWVWLTLWSAAALSAAVMVYRRWGQDVGEYV